MQKSHTALAALMTSAMTFTSIPVLAAGDTARTNATGTTNTANTAGTTANRNAANQATMQNDAYVTLTGKVTAITENDAFQLDYGQGIIRVDTNDGRSNIFQGAGTNTGNVLREGDQVTVTGRIDNNWFTEREIDAQAIRTSNGKTYSRDTNWLNTNNWARDNVDEDRVRITGTITEVVNDNRYRMRFSGQQAGTNTQQAATIEIDTTGIIGGKDQRFNVGDRVTVVGELDDTFFRGREINVDTIQYAGQGTNQPNAAASGRQMNEASPSAGQNTNTNRY